MNRNWYSGLVLHGQENGRKIGFPTVNLSPSIMNNSIKKGIYACYVKYKEKTYIGALYFGNKSNEKGQPETLEIHILNFDLNIYDETVEFKLIKFIHTPKIFTSFEEAKKQIAEDVNKIKILHKKGDT